MKIAIVCDILNDAINGTNLTTYNLISYLRSKGHEVRIICCDITKQGINDYYIIPTMNYGFIVNYLVKKSGILAANPRRGKDILKEAISGCDLVHTMLPFKLCKAALKEANKQGIPTTAGCHLLPENLTSYIYLNHVPGVTAFFYHRWNSTFKKASYRHYPTQLIRDRYEKHIGRTNGTVISNGIPADIEKHFVTKPIELKDKIVILTVGRYGRDKNQDCLIKAIRYSKYKDQIQIIAAGYGWKDKYFKKLGKKLPNPPILKSFNRHDLQDVINYSDICCHPAFVEAEGMSVLEQLACGKLVIVSDGKTAAPKYYINDDRAIFKAKHPKDLAAKIDWWIEHPAEKAEVEQRNFEFAKTLKLNVCLDKMEKMFNKVIEFNKNKK